MTRYPPVTFVASHSELGGQESYLLSILRTLPPDAIRGVVALHDGPALPRLAALGHRTWLVPTPARLGILPAAVRLRRVLRAGDAELVHADGGKAALCCALALTGTGVPIVWMKHDTSFDGPLARWIGARCAAIAGVSPTVTATFAHGDVHVVPNGVPAYDIPRDAARRELLALLDAPPEAEVVVQVGRLVPTKGQLDTVAAAARLRRPGLRVALVGAPDRHAHEYAERLRERAAGAGATLLGYRDDATRLMAGADVVVVPSLPRGGVYGGGEGFGLVAAEAMAVGTPVLAYDVPALPDTLGGAGALVPPGDIEAYARTLGELLDDHGRRERMAAAGRARARTFSLDAAVARLQDVYRSASRGRQVRGTARR
ncbi:glycosyltransferase [Candidatus Solirubrobacter pratensis]|uniref:glycosyltransferase n=1 Tax=Candidatus Solirubrobacter pratensis TaxID=1298857 RepID=UPI000688739E|nr:glycosyltransferase [Candidatus Solirubrobacter pratensis]